MSDLRLIDAYTLMDDISDFFKTYTKPTKENLISLVNTQKVVNEWHVLYEDDPDSFPPDDSYILLSFANFDIPMGGRYEANEDGGGSFYVGDDERTCVQHGLFVNAWIPLPKCYNDD